MAKTIPHSDILQTEIKKWRQHKDPLAHAAVAELMHIGRSEFDLESLRQRHALLSDKCKLYENESMKHEIRAINRARRKYRRQAVKELGIKLKEVLT